MNSTSQSRESLNSRGMLKFGCENSWGGVGGGGEEIALGGYPTSCMNPCVCVCVCVCVWSVPLAIQYTDTCMDSEHCYTNGE